MTSFQRSALAIVCGLVTAAASTAQNFPDELPKPSLKKSTKSAARKDDLGPADTFPDSPARPARSMKKSLSLDPGPELGDATPAALLKSMRDSLQVVADDGNPAEVRAAFRKAFDAILAASEKIVQNPKSSVAEKTEAYQYQASILYQGARKGELGFTERLERLAETLYRTQAKTDVANFTNLLSVKARYDEDEGLRTDSLPAIREYLKKYPHEEAVIDLLLDVAQRAEMEGTPAVAKEALAIIPANFKRHETASKVPAMLKRVDLVGKKLSLELSLMDGRQFTLDERKRIVIVDFWATTSAPSVAEQDVLKDLYSRFKDEGLEIVGVPLDDRESAVQQFLSAHKANWPQNVIPIDEKAHGFNHPIARQYGVVQLPTNFLIENGKVVATQIRGPALKRKVEELAGKPATKTAGKASESPLFK
jgi:thiol-disulfide isomerase/thioredoxin